MAKKERGRALSTMRLQEIDRLLGEVPSHLWRDCKLTATAESLLKAAKHEAVAVGDQLEAKRIWCWESALKMQQMFVAAFEDLKDGRHYGAWCTLERIEIAGVSWRRHCESDCEAHRIGFILRQVGRLQALFPYTHFISPALLEKRMKCTICGKEISVRNPCGHQKGEIYDGELCLREVVESEVLEVSIVTNPVQKYSVVFPSEDGKKGDPYDYTLVDYVIRGLRRPFDGWKATWTKARHPHSLYSHVAAQDPCPCGSGKLYSDCCLPEKGVLRPHVMIEFDVPPPDDLPSVVLPSPRRSS